MNGLEDETETMDKCVKMWNEILELSKITEVDSDGDFYVGAMKERAILNLFPQFKGRWNHDCPLCHYYKKSAECPLAITRKQFISFQDDDFDDEGLEEHECFVGCQEKYGFGKYMKPNAIKQFVKTLESLQKKQGV